MRFTDGHSSPGFCSPSRYRWRGKPQKGIVGLWEPPAIPADRMTIASFAKQPNDIKVVRYPKSNRLDTE